MPNELIEHVKTAFIYKVNQNYNNIWRLMEKLKINDYDIDYEYSWVDDKFLIGSIKFDAKKYWIYEKEELIYVYNEYDKRVTCNDTVFLIKSILNFVDFKLQ